MSKTRERLTYQEQMEFNVFESVEEPYYQKKMEDGSPPIEGGYFWNKMQELNKRLNND